MKEKSLCSNNTLLLLFILLLSLVTAANSIIGTQIKELRASQEALSLQIIEQKEEYKTLTHPKVIQSRTVDYITGQGEFKERE